MFSSSSYLYLCLEVLVLVSGAKVIDSASGQNAEDKLWTKAISKCGKGNRFPGFLPASLQFFIFHTSGHINNILSDYVVY